MVRPTIKPSASLPVEEGLGSKSVEDDVHNDADDDNDDDDDEDATTATAVSVASASSCSSSSSVATEVALFDMLGLPSPTIGTSMLRMDDDDDEPAEADADADAEVDDTLCNNKKGTSNSNGNDNTMIIERIALPTSDSRPHTPSESVSRTYHDPEHCFAYTIQNVVSREECQQLIAIAATSSNTTTTTTPAPTSSSFQYITHAVHTAPDGHTKLDVQLARPNPHKLAVFQHPSSVELIWQRLQPILTATTTDTNKNTTTNNNKNDTTTATTTTNNLWAAMRQFQHREEATVVPHASSKKNKKETETTNTTTTTTNTNTNTNKPLLPPIGLNPRLRVLKYDATDQDEFLPHFDATTELTLSSSSSSLSSSSLGGHNTATTQRQARKSYITVLLYLNEGKGYDFQGGETEFLIRTVDEDVVSSKKKNTTTYQQHTYTRSGNTTATSTKIVPKTGTIVLFEHDLYHRGCPLISGTKYVLRTDIMFPATTTNTAATATATATGNGVAVGATGITATTETTSSEDDDDDCETPTIISTVEDILSAMTAIVNSTHDDATDTATNCAASSSSSSFPLVSLLRDALSNGLGLGPNLDDTSIQCLCCPGRYALQVMLREHCCLALSSSLVNDNHTNTSNKNITNIDPTVIITTTTSMIHQLISQFIEIAFQALRDNT